MLDQLFNSIGGDVVKSLTEKTGISTEQAQEVLPVAQESIQQGLLKEATGGNLAGILGMFNNSNSMSNSPVFGGIKQIFMTNLLSKLGLPEGIAKLIAGAGLENILGKIGNKLKSDGGEVTKDDLMSKLGLGGAISGMAQNMVKNKLDDLAKDKLGGLGGLFGK